MKEEKVKHFTHVSQEDFDQIQRLIKRGFNNADIKVATKRGPNVLIAMRKAKNFADYRRLMSERSQSYAKSLKSKEISAVKKPEVVQETLFEHKEIEELTKAVVELKTAVYVLKAEIVKRFPELPVPATVATEPN